MAANIADKFVDPNSSGRPVPTTLTAEKQVADSSITCASLSGWATDTAVHFVIYETDTDGNKVAGTQSDWKGIVSGSTINTLTLTGGTDQVYPIGATVVAAPTAGWGSDLVTGILEEHDQDGTHKNITTDTIVTTGLATVGGDIKVADTKSIIDGNSNELVKFSQTASAVNELTVKNAATTTAPQLQATGSDTNIDVNIVPKGTGEVTKNGYPIDWWEEIGRTTLSVAGDTIAVSSLPARKYLRVIVYADATGGTTDLVLRANSDSGTNYSRRASTNGAADTSSASVTSLLGIVASSNIKYAIVDIFNMSGKPKHGFVQIMEAGSPPGRIEGVSRWDTTSGQITDLTLINGGTGDYAIGSEVIVLGHD